MRQFRCAKVLLDSKTDFLCERKRVATFRARNLETCQIIRVARWHIFQTKIPIWVHFGGSSKGRCWYILWSFGLFYEHLVYFVVFW
jgi:hypothetical protein